MTDGAAVIEPVIGPVTDPVIATRGLTKHFGTVRALDDLDLAVPRGSVFGFLGPNGSGKTTTIRLLLALVRPTDGEARILGQPVEPGAPVLGQVGALVERPAFYPYLSAFENLRVFAAARGLREPSAHDRVPHRRWSGSGSPTSPNRKVGGFSTGMRQRLGIGLAMLDAPPIIILDEPTSGLDPEGTVDVRNLITGLAHDHATVFLSTHLLNEAEQVCTQLAVIARGRIVTQGVHERPLRRRASTSSFASRPPAERDAGAGRCSGAAGLTARPAEVATIEVDGQPDGSVADSPPRRCAPLPCRGRVPPSVAGADLPRAHRRGHARARGVPT